MLTETSLSEAVSADAVVVDTNEPTTNLYNEPLRANNFVVSVTFQGAAYEVRINDHDYISDAKFKIHHQLKQHYPTESAFLDTKILKFGIKKFCLMWEFVDEDGKTKKMNTIEFNDDVDAINKTTIQNNQTIALSILSDGEMTKLLHAVDQTDREILMLEILCCPCITVGVAAACAFNVAAQVVCCYYRKEMRENAVKNGGSGARYREKSVFEVCLC